MRDSARGNNDASSSFLERCVVLALNKNKKKNKKIFKILYL